MKRRSIRKKESWDERAVSEVIGTILILAITVVLFSVIIVWVGSFPAPEASVRLTMRGELEPIVNAGVWGGAKIYITHERGEALQGFMTNVIIAVSHQGGGYGEDRLDLQGTQAGMPYGLVIDDTWNTGETWSYTNYSIAASDRVEVFIIDTVAGQVLWRANILGREASHFPIFIEKWTDAWPQTIFTRDIVEDDDLTFAVYASIEDNDGDLDPAKVSLLLTWVEIETRLFDNGLHGDRVAADGIYSYDFDNYFTDTGFQFPGIELTWDGGIMLFNATDDQNHTTQSRMNLVVVLSEQTKQDINLQQNLTLPPGGPGNLSFGNRLQRFDIFNFTDWQTLRWQSNSTRQFVKGEIAVVLVASKTLEANDEENSFMIYNSQGVPQVFCGVVPGPATVPSSTDAFIFLDAVGKWTVFMYMFNTSSEAIGCGDGKLDYGRYPIEVTIRDTYGNRFHTVDRINVTDEDGNIPDYPDMLIYCDSGHLVPCKEYNFTDTVYVKIIVNTAQTDMGGVDIGDVIIEDYVGGKQVWAPPGVTPVSDAENNNSVSYKFSIDLSKPNVDPWLQGDNYYGFWVRSLVDDDEEYILALSMQIKVNGPRWNLDIVTPVQEFAHPTHDIQYYAFFYDNVAPMFPRDSIEEFEPFPSQQDPPWGEGAFLSIAMIDIDLDQDLDVVIGIEAGYVFWYRNIGGDGELWLRYEIDFLDSEVNAVDAADLDDDRDADIVAGAENGQIWWYKNGAAWSPTLVDSVGAAVNSIKLADVVGDELPDIVVACDDNKVRVYKNDNGTFGSTTSRPYYALSETTNVGTIVSGSYAQTLDSDNVYEQLREGTGDAYTTTTYNATADEKPFYGSVSGTYLNTHTDDGTYEILTEGVDTQGGDKYIYRNTSAGVNTGHFYMMGDVNVQAGDSVDLIISGFIIPDSGASTEPWAIGFYDTAFHWPAGWTFSSTIETKVTLDLAGALFAGGPLAIVIRDTDNSKNPSADGNTDGTITSFKIDFLRVEVRHQSGQTSVLDHVWTFDDPAAGGDAYKFFVEAYRPTNSEGDNFKFQYSLNAAGPWSDLLTVSKAVDDGKTQSATMPTSVGGNTVYIRVIDTDGTMGNLQNDSVYVDYMRIDRIVVVFQGDDRTEINVGSAVNDVAVGDMDEDDVNDIVCSFAVSPYVRVYYGGDWTASDSLTASADTLAIDIGYFDGDDYLDVVAGTTDNKVYIWINGQARGAWTRSNIANTAGDIYSIRAGDIDGDRWDDIVYGTDLQELVYLRHVKGAYWESNDVNIDPELVTTFFDIDIGDANRGIILDPVRAEK
ncbi:MAG: VCBS repeat-containing protein [Thermoplasmata archaeon]|nr:VCBS repeat-containing protein [Thermoplasmata archaeon]